MNIDRRWYLLFTVAATAAAGAAVALTAHRRHRRTMQQPQDTAALKDWENEGGNLAPIPAALATQ
jgi:hypothetical protein